MDTINHRIKKVIEEMGITAYEFSKKMGDKRPDTLYNLLKNNETQPSPKTLNKIKDNFPEINYSWLLTGDGEMLKNNFIERKDLGSGFKERKELRTGFVEKKNIPNNFNEHKEINLLEPTGYYLPEVSASAGLETQMHNDELKRIPVIIPGWDKEVVFINVYGDSMYPKYNSGEIIGVKFIEFDYLNYGSAYVVVLQNGDTHIKILQPGSDKEHLVLESINEFFKPKEYHLSKLKSFYAIKGVIKKEMM